MAASTRLDPLLYADVVERGGVTAAIMELALEVDADVGHSMARPGHEDVTAEFSSDRGTIGVLVGKKERYFSIVLVGSGHVWVEGGTTDLEAVVQVISSWRQGTPVERIGTDFPFMELGHLAAEFERGEHTAAQWRALLDDPDLDLIRPLLIRANSSPKLRALFPSVSHLNMLRLVDDPQATSEEISIMFLPDVFIVESSTGGAEIAVRSAEEAVELAATFCRSSIIDEGHIGG